MMPARKTIPVSGFDLQTTLDYLWGFAHTVTLCQSAFTRERPVEHDWFDYSVFIALGPILGTGLYGAIHAENPVSVEYPPDRELRNKAVDRYKETADVWIQRLDAGPEKAMRYLTDCAHIAQGNMLRWNALNSRARDINERVVERLNNLTHVAAVVKMTANIALKLLPGGAPYSTALTVADAVIKVLADPKEFASATVGVVKDRGEEYLKELAKAGVERRAADLAIKQKLLKVSEDRMGKLIEIYNETQSSRTKDMVAKGIWSNLEAIGQSKKVIKGMSAKLFAAKVAQKTSSGVFVVWGIYDDIKECIEAW